MDAIEKYCDAVRNEYPIRGLNVDKSGVKPILTIDIDKKEEEILKPEIEYEDGFLNILLPSEYKSDGHEHPFIEVSIDSMSYSEISQSLFRIAKQTGEGNINKYGNPEDSHEFIRTPAWQKQ